MAKEMTNPIAVKKFFGNDPSTGGYAKPVDFMKDWKHLTDEDKKELGDLARAALNG